MASLLSFFKCITMQFSVLFNFWKSGITSLMSIIAISYKEKRNVNSVHSEKSIECNTNHECFVVHVHPTFAYQSFPPPPTAGIIAIFRTHSDERINNAGSTFPYNPDFLVYLNAFALDDLCITVFVVELQSVWI